MAASGEPLSVHRSIGYLLFIDTAFAIQIAQILDLYLRGEMFSTKLGFCQAFLLAFMQWTEFGWRTFPFFLIGNFYLFRIDLVTIAQLIYTVSVVSF